MINTATGNDQIEVSIVTESVMFLPNDQPNTTSRWTVSDKNLMPSSSLDYVESDSFIFGKSKFR